MPLLLCLWPYQYDHHQSPKQVSSRSCRSQQHFSPDTFQHGHCTWLRRSHHPLITSCTMLCGLTGYFRGVLYLTSQTMGAALAGGMLCCAFDAERAIESHGIGCFCEPGSVTAEQALLLETVSSFAFLVVALGVALDPRQQTLFGPLAAPLAVGCSLGLMNFASAGMVPGYTGATMNPAKCFAFAISRRNFVDQWIWWRGPFCRSWLLAIAYIIAPHIRGHRKNRKLRGGGNKI